MGGPVRIPKVYNGEDKTFFLVSYEGLRVTQPTAASSQWVPDLAIRQSAAAGIRPILNAFPLPTGTSFLIGCGQDSGITCPAGQADGTLVPSGLAPYNMSSSSPSQFDSTSVRIDHNFSSKMNLFFRWGNTPSFVDSRSESTVSGNHANVATYTGGLTDQFTSTLGNTFRLNYSDSTNSSTRTLDNFGGATPLNLVQAIGLGSSPSPLPIFFFNVGGVGYASMSTSTSSNVLRQWNAIDILSKSLGCHQLKMGVDYRRIDSPLNPFLTQGTAYFFSAQAVEISQPDLSLIWKYQHTEPVFNDSAAFIQDEWRVTRRLNLSLGLRWDVDPPPTSANGLDAFTLNGTLGDPASLTLAPRGTPLWKTTYYNFAPRLGGAYQLRTKPGWETVVRAGGGVFYDTDNEAAAWGFSAGLGSSATTRFSNAAFPFTPAMINSLTVSISPPYTNAVIYDIPRHLQLPYTLQWNVAVQQALGKGQTLTVSYVGSAGRRLLAMQSLTLTALNPNFGAVNYIPRGITSDYDALQVKFQRSLGHGVQALASYTWSHSIDYGSSAVETALTRGNSDFDLRHNFQAGLTWNLPKVNGNEMVKQTFSHWAIDGRLFAQSGFPVTVTGQYLTDPTTGNEYTAGVNYLHGSPIYVNGQYPGGKIINPAAFCDPNAGACPANSVALPRNYLRSFGNNQLNLAIRREFPIRESLRLQFRAEAYNIFNHPNFSGVDSSLADSNFGYATSMLGGLYTQGGSRSMQFALKLLF